MYKDCFDKEYQKLVGYNSPEVLHLNSQELVSVLKKFDVLKDDIHVFEIGSGGARNLKYINDANPTIKLSANDLYKDASFEQMHESIKDKITFYEMDTLSLVQNVNPSHIDLLVASDHLMHIEKEIVEEIVDLISNKWKPDYILLREVKPSGHKINRTYPRLHHKLDFQNYDVLEHIDTQTMPTTYYIKLLKRNLPSPLESDGMNTLEQTQISPEL